MLHANGDALFKLALVQRVVGPNREGSLQLDKRVGVAGELRLHAVHFPAQDEPGVPQLGLHDAAPLYRRVDIAAPGWSPVRRGRLGRGAPRFKRVAVVHRLVEPGFWIVPGAAWLLKCKERHKETYFASSCASVRCSSK
jgi:hypothetical protein